MSTKDINLNSWYYLSLLCFVLGILAWMPNFIFKLNYSYWLLTFIINPIGIWFGIKAKSRTGILLNIIMTFSFFIVMMAGYISNAIFGGRP